MEVLSARMAPAFKGEESWKYKRLFENKHARQADVKVEHRSDRTSNYEVAPLRESGHRKLYAGGANGWDGGSRQPAGPRSIGRMNTEGSSMSNGYVRRATEIPEESSDEPETSQEMQPDDSDNSGDEEPADGPNPEAPQKWPIIQIVEPPPWLPERWTAVLRTRESGSKDKYYVDPESQRRFRSKTEVNYFLQTGKSYRYKRNLALLTKPLKEDPVSLPSTASMRNVHVDIPSARESAQTLPFMSPGPVFGGESRGMGAVPARSAQATDQRLSMVPYQAELPRKPYNKPGPKPKIKGFSEESTRSVSATVSKRNAIEERKAPENSQGTENRGKLILKLKRKTAEPDEGQKNGKKPRPFEVVGATPVLQGKSRSSTSDEDERHQKNHWAVDQAVEISSRVPHSLVPSTHVSKRPISKAPLPPWQFQPQSSSYSRPQHGGNGSLPSTSNGQGLDRTSGSATLSVADSETAKIPPKRESPAEQLQRLGRRLCLQAVGVLSSEYGGRNTLQQISSGLHGATSHGLNTPFNNVFSPTFNPGFRAPSAYQHQPIKRMRGSLQKDKSIAPMQKYGLDQRFTVPPQTQ